tara:strand:- start:249 stop:650 length:402 start_codon:yes stop_codon:yes gene_type:complete
MFVHDIERVYGLDEDQESIKKALKFLIEKDSDDDCFSENFKVRFLVTCPKDCDNDRKELVEDFFSALQNSSSGLIRFKDTLPMIKVSGRIYEQGVSINTPLSKKVVKDIIKNFEVSHSKTRQVTLSTLTEQKS